MTRRAGLVLAASCAWLPRLLLAQPARPARIGLLVPPQQQARASELVEHLQPLGWRPRDNLDVQQRVGDTPQGLQEQAAELVRLQVDVIVALLTPRCWQPDARRRACRS